MIENFQIDMFAGLAGERLSMTLSSGESLTFELESVTPLSEQTADPLDLDRRAPFSLILLGPPGMSVPQGSYHFNQANTGEFDMFVVPIERRGDRLVYQAIFN